MNEMYYRIDRRLKDPLFDAKCTKRELNKRVKKVRENIENCSIRLGSYGVELEDLYRELDKVNLTIEKLEEGNWWIWKMKKPF